MAIKQQYPYQALNGLTTIDKVCVNTDRRVLDPSAIDDSEGL